MAIEDYRRFAHAIDEEFEEVSVQIDTNAEHGWRTLIVDTVESEETTVYDIIDYIEDIENIRDIIGFGADSTDLHHVKADGVLFVKIE